MAADPASFSLAPRPDYVISDAKLLIRLQVQGPSTCAQVKASHGKYAAMEIHRACDGQEDCCVLEREIAGSSTKFYEQLEEQCRVLADAGTHGGALRFALYQAAHKLILPGVKV